MRSLDIVSEPVHELQRYDYDSRHGNFNGGPVTSEFFES